MFAGGITGLNWREAKGRRALNADEVIWLYAELWRTYTLDENPHLLDVLKRQTGLQDKFGQPGHCCQATELWKIRCEALRTHASLPERSRPDAPDLFVTTAPKNQVRMMHGIPF